MSDFTSGFWSVFVAGITALSIAACLLLLWISGKTKAMTAHDNTTGHVWDGDLREMNNPLPRWWVGLFIITVLFAIAYLFLYPGMGTYQGSLRWSSTDQFDREVTRGNEQVAPLYAKFAGMSTEQLAKNPEAMGIGDRLFMNNCAQCHGSDARGSKGFPNLTDADWNWGGTPDKIHETIARGRMGIMPPQAAAVGTPDDVRNLSNYVLSLSGAPHDSTRAGLGKSKFVACAACHGQDGKGNQALGAPNLTDKVWFLGPGVESHVVNMINTGRTGVMPAWESKFTPEQLKVLTAYVWGKGGGVAGVPSPTAAAPTSDDPSVSVENGVVKFFFASGKAELAGGADKALAEVVAGVQAGRKIAISGFVDSTGNAAQNAELAKQRAFAVRDRLTALGVTEDKIELKKPGNPEAGAGAAARRVEVSLL